jgi:hypothetical protein
MLLGEKRDGTIKGRMVYNGKPTGECLSREDSASPTAALESIMVTAVIDAHEGRVVMTCNIPNAFIEALMPEVKEGDDRVMMKITGVLAVDMSVGLNPELYGPYVVYKKNCQFPYGYARAQEACPSTWNSTSQVKSQPLRQLFKRQTEIASLAH